MWVDLPDVSQQSIESGTAEKLSTHLDITRFIVDEPFHDKRKSKHTQSISTAANLDMFIFLATSTASHLFSRFTQIAL